MSTENKLNAATYIQQMLGDVDDVYILSFDTLVLLLRTYGKEVMLECHSRVKLVPEEVYDEREGVYDYPLRLDDNSILSIMSEL